MNKKIKIILILILLAIILLVSYKYFGLREKILKLQYPMKYEEYVNKYSKESDIDPLLIMAIIKTESNFNKDAVSRSGAVGLMQLMKDTAKENAEKVEIEYTNETLYNPEDNIRIGIKYYKSLLDYYNQNYILAFVAYNAGMGNVNKWIKEQTINDLGTDIENIPFKETNLYVRKIVKNYEIYKSLYEKEN